MKKIITTALLLLFLIAPQTHAQTTDRAALLAQIQQLLSLIESLQQQLETRQGVSTTFMIPSATEPVEKAITLHDFPEATQSWSNSIQIGSVPKNSYKAHYFNTKQPDTIVKSEIVPKVAVSYTWADGQGFKINSEDFGGFWIGDIDISSDGNYTISTAESWSESRVFIDDRLIKTQSRDEVTLFLEEGTYRVEVEYVNNWHTTDFAMNILPEESELSLAEVKTKLSKYSDAENWYVGVYESGNFNKSITVDVTDMDKESILFLSSYSQVEWNIDANSSLKAVVYASYEAGTMVQGVPDGVPVFKVGYDTLASEYSLEEHCDSYRGTHFSACEYIDQLNKVDSSVRGLTGSLTDTFSGGYSETYIKAPEIELSSAKRNEFLESYEAAKEEAVSELESQSIGNIF